MAAPDSAEERRWRATLAPYFGEFGLPLPEPSTAGARRPIDVATVDLLEAFRPRVLSFHFGLPEASLVARMKAWGAIVMSSATTLAEGLWLERHGADVVIAQASRPVAIGGISFRRNCMTSLRRWTWSPRSRAP
jgi:nitronate monooxygenase